MYSILAITFAMWAFHVHRVLCSSLSQNGFVGNNTEIVTRVTSSNGTDMSSNFQTLVFIEPPRDNLSNLTDRQVSWTRDISFCRSSDAVFQYSFCRRHRETPADMLAYTVVCKAPPPGRGYFSPRTVIEPGSCTTNEMCVDGPTAPRSRGRPLPTEAKCVGKAGFLPAGEKLQFGKISNFKLQEHQQTGHLAFSFPDKSTPLQARYVGVNTISHNTTNRQISRDSTCQDCSGLPVSEAGDEIDLLKTQAIFQGASTGILWLAFLSAVG